MNAIRDLPALLENLEPRHIPGEFVFCSIDSQELQAFGDTPLLVFRESEGVTIVVLKDIALQHSLTFDNIWGLLTLSVHSDLEAVGLLAIVTKILAESGISVNVVSAYYHDHLFVPYSLVFEALKILEEVSDSTKR